jgi:hypothetical protein
MLLRLFERGVLFARWGCDDFDAVSDLKGIKLDEDRMPLRALGSICLLWIKQVQGCERERVEPSTPSS